MTREGRTRIKPDGLTAEGSDEATSCELGVWPSAWTCAGHQVSVKAGLSTGRRESTHNIVRFDPPTILEDNLATALLVQPLVPTLRHLGSDARDGVDAELSEPLRDDVVQLRVEARHEATRLDQRDVSALGRVEDRQVASHLCGRALSHE